MVNDIERQLRARPDTAAWWGLGGQKQKLGQLLRPLLAAHFGWPNDHFLPDDLFRFVFWAHQDALDAESAIEQIEKTFGVTVSDADLERIAPSGTLGDFVDLISSLPCARG